jgi:cation transport ATPase
MKLYTISRFLFFIFAIIQGSFFSRFMVAHINEYGFYGLATMFAIPLLFLAVTLHHNGLKYRLGVVWFLYSCILVIMIAIIFGEIVIKDNKLRNEVEESKSQPCIDGKNNYAFQNISNTSMYNESVNQRHSDKNTTKIENSKKTHPFFDSTVLTLTLSLTPAQMLLLLTSAADESEISTDIYFTTTMNLFDGVEMLEVLLQVPHGKIPKGWEIAVVVVVCIYYFVSFLEIHQIKFVPKENNRDTVPVEMRTKTAAAEENSRDTVKMRKKTAAVNTIFQLIFNACFMVIRLVLWLRFHVNAAVFLIKNVIALVILLVALYKTYRTRNENDQDTQQNNTDIGHTNTL